jgi:hypothetical protein
MELERVEWTIEELEAILYVLKHYSRFPQPEALSSLSG